jgi:hypothetical protein
MNRFYTLYFYNTFKSKSFSKWQRISKNIQNKIKEKEIIHQYATKLFLNNSSVSDKKEEKKEETKILKNEYVLNFDGYTVINKELNNRIDYSFPDGYECVIIRRYFSDTLEFINEYKYQGYLYKNSLKTYNSLNEMK